MKTINISTTDQDTFLKLNTIKLKYATEVMAVLQLHISEIYPGENLFIRNLFKDFYHLFDSSGSDVSCKAAIAQRPDVIIINLSNEHLHEVTDAIHQNIAIADLKFIQKAYQIVEDNIKNSTFNVDNFTQAIGMSRAQLYRKIYGISGQSVKEFIRVIRLKKAAVMLTQSSYNISEVAYRVGFNSIAYFTKSFNHFYGQTPSKYVSNYHLFQHNLFSKNEDIPDNFLLLCVY